MTVMVLMGGMSSEREVSLNTGRAVASALETVGHNVLTYDLDPAGGNDVYRLVTSHELKSTDVVFIALHGGEGEDGRIQALLELLGIPYTGSGVRASSVSMDKSISKIIFERNGVRTPEWVHLQQATADPAFAEAAVTRLGGWPVVVKPIDQGSTIGISIVSATSGLAGAIQLAQRYSPGVILERYIEGRELSVPILGEEVLPIVEITPKEGFYDYKRKYTKGMTDYECPAPIDDGTGARIGSDALTAYKVLGCEGFGRVDLRLGKDGTPYFLEVNTIPGMTETSLVPMGAKARGISFPDLCDRITRLALDKVKTGIQ
jgi:D-alanine-D-alanine ligase